MFKAMGLALLLALGAAASETVIEPATQKVFPAKLETPGGELENTGTTYRSKWTFKVYAIAHYGQDAVATAKEKPEARRKNWINADTAKAFVLKFSMDVDGEKMRDATAEAFDRTGFNGPSREKFLKAMDVHYPENSTLKLVATKGGKLTATLDDAELGTWEDPALVRALWSVWLDEGSVLADPDKIVSEVAE